MNEPAGLSIDLVDPVVRRVLRREALDGEVWVARRVADRLVLLLSPREDIGTARLVSVDAAGAVRSVALDRVSAGIRWDRSTDQPKGTVRGPGLAIDPEGRHAYVVGAGEPVAEVDLEAMAVSYHALSRPVSVLGRLRDWLEPAAEAKGLDGPSRDALWVGDGLVAVAGSDGHISIDKNGDMHEDFTPTGLQLVDTRNWSVRTLNAAATQVWAVGETLLAMGPSPGCAQAGSVALIAYALDGSERFRLCGEKPLGFVETAGPYAYVPREGNRLTVIDVRTGSVVRRLAWTQIVPLAKDAFSQ